MVRTRTKPTPLMDQLFLLNVGVLFGAFLSIWIWTRGVPRKLATLGGFVAGITLLFCFLLSAVGHHWLRQHFTLVRGVMLCGMLALGVVAWPLWLPGVVSSWPYEHGVRTGVTGVVGFLVACGLFAFVFTKATALFTSQPRAYGFAVITATLGASVLLVAATLIVGTPSMWPESKSQIATEWYRWLTQGLALMPLGLAVASVAAGERVDRPISRLTGALACGGSWLAGATVLFGFDSFVAMLLAQVLLAVWVVSCPSPRATLP